MSSASHNGDSDHRLFKSARIEGFDVSWVGPNPFADGFCYGSDDGRYLLADEHGSPTEGPAKGSISGEAVNSVARSGDWLAISTRAEINFIGNPRGIFAFRHGAHGVSALPNGRFVAPLGHEGLAVMKPTGQSEDAVTFFEAKKDDFYFYKTVALQGQAGQNPIVCAGRLGGIGITEFAEGQKKQHLRTVTFENLDVVDVCFIGTAAYPFAVAALGRDGSIVLFKDVQEHKKPTSLKFDTVSGKAYRLLSCQGDLHVLTSAGLFGLLNLAERFLDNALVNGPPTRILKVEMEAVDANVVGNRWLMLVLPGEVRKYDVQMIHEEAHKHSQYGEFQDFRPTPLSPEWHWSQAPSELMPAGS